MRVHATCQTRHEGIEPAVRDVVHREEEEEFEDVNGLSDGKTLRLLRLSFTFTQALQLNVDIGRGAMHGVPHKVVCVHEGRGRWRRGRRESRAEEVQHWRHKEEDDAGDEEGEPEADILGVSYRTFMPATFSANVDEMARKAPRLIEW
jgi:hypothetical protein